MNLLAGYAFAFAAAPVMDAGSQVSLDDDVLLFDTAARLSEDRARWIVPIHGWVYTPQQSRTRRALVAAALRATYGLEETPTTRANFLRRANLFIASNHRDRRVRVEICGETHTLPPSRKNGHFQGQISIPAHIVEQYTRQRRLEARIVLPEGDDRWLTGSVHLLSPEGLSVISDIDDTVKVTGVSEMRSMMDNTFFRDFSAVRGMSDLYARWAGEGATIHFISSSPWHIYEPLVEFLEAHGFPRATLSLKDFRFKDTTLLNLFKRGAKTKPPLIEALLKAHPRRRFILVGDSVEQDPEIYAAILRAHPSQVERIYIRCLDGAGAAEERFREAFAGIAENSWQVFRDPAEIRFEAT